MNAGSRIKELIWTRKLNIIEVFLPKHVVTDMLRELVTFSGMDFDVVWPCHLFSGCRQVDWRYFVVKWWIMRNLQDELM